MRVIRTVMVAVCLVFAPEALAQPQAPEPGTVSSPGPSSPAPGGAKDDPSAPSNDPAADAEAFAKARETFEKSITRVKGQVALVANTIMLNVPNSYYYLDRDDAKKVLEDLWGNPPDSAPLGMLFPDRFSAIDPDAWGVVITYEDTGYVSDSDAAKINYDDLMRDIRDENKRENPSRKAKGYPTVDVRGWATQPRYDAKTHKLYWAEDVVFDDNDKVHTLNYDMRVLGRSGVLQLKFVAAMEDLRAVEQAGPIVLSGPEFMSGARYEDFNPATDKKADYGVAGLIAGGTLGGLLLAKNTGILGLLLVVLQKAWFVVIAAFAGVGAWVRNMFGGGKKTPGKPGGERPSAMSTDFFDKPSGSTSEPPSNDPTSV